MTITLMIMAIEHTLFFVTNFFTVTFDQLNVPQLKSSKNYL